MLFLGPGDGKGIASLGFGVAEKKVETVRELFWFQALSREVRRPVRRGILYIDPMPGRAYVGTLHGLDLERDLSRRLGLVLVLLPHRLLGLTRVF